MALSGNSHFAYAPNDIKISRSRLDRSHSYKTSMNVGELIPILCEEVLPGDTFDIKTSKVVRLQTLLTPMMDNIYLDTYYFYVPNRLVWSHFKEFMGENKDSAWIPQVEYSMPQVTSPDSTGWNTGSLADYFGMPTGIPGISVDARYFRAYALIVEEWFRNQNIQDPVSISFGDATVAGSNGNNYITDLVKGGMPFVANKFKDQFTSCLPSPQKGPDVSIDLGGYADVLVGDSRSDNLDSNSVHGLRFYAWNGNSNSYVAPDKRMVGLDGSANNVLRTDPDQVYGSANTGTPIVPNNLYADLSAISAFSINDLRLAFQIQRFYERSARSGSRYVETIKAFFGVDSPDYRLQRPEYLGGNRVPLNINQVIQQSESTASSPLANTAGMSLTSDVHSDFVKSFTEHGIILGLCVARYDHSYQQGLARKFTRKTKFDFYWPIFSSLGEQPVLLKELYCDGSSDDDTVFGYQEAWFDYRYAENLCTGEMRSTASASLDSWHLGDDYNSAPSLSPTWISEDKTNVDRVLAVTSSVANQIFMDVYFKEYATRPMPVYSIPGLIDHF